MIQTAICNGFTRKFLVHVNNGGQYFEAMVEDDSRHCEQPALREGQCPLLRY